MTRHLTTWLRGFALAPLLYIIALAGIAGAVLFTGYTQILRSNVEITADNAVRNQIRAASETLAARALIQGNPANLLPPTVVAWNGLDAARIPRNSAGTAAVTQSEAEGGASGVTAGGVPTTGGVRAFDPWGRHFIMCRWVSPQSPGSDRAMALISAGADGRLQSTCNSTAAAGDDRMELMSVANVMSRSATWQTMADNTYRFGVTGDPAAARVEVGIDDGSRDLTKSFDIGGPARFRNTLQVDGAMTTNGTVNMASMTASGNITGGSLTSNGTLNVTGLSTLAGLNAGVTSLGGTTAATLGVTGATTLAATTIGTVGTPAPLTVNGTLTAGASTLGATTTTSLGTGAITASGLISADGGVQTTNIASSGATVNVNDNLQVNGAMAATGTISAPTGSFTNLTVTNPITGSVTGGAGSVPGTGITGIVPLTAGGTGVNASSNANLRTALGIQTYDDDLQALADATTTGFIRRSGAGTVSIGPILQNEVPVFSGASAGTAGSQGGVPTPTAGQQNLFLRGDGTWATATGGSTITQGDSGVSVVDAGTGAIVFTVDGVEQGRVTSTTGADRTFRLTGGTVAGDVPPTFSSFAASGNVPLRLATQGTGNIFFRTNGLDRITIDGATGVTSGSFSGPLAGNATTATTLQTARNFSMSGDATATAVSFNGGANVDLVASVVRLQGRNVAATAPTTNQVLGWNGTTWLPQTIGTSLDGTTIGSTTGVRILAQDGTAAAPAYSFASDTDTGIYREGSDALSFSTNGLRRMMISNAGAVTIARVVSDSASQFLVNSAAGGYSWLRLRAHGGTIAAPAATGTGVDLGQIFFEGHDGTNVQFGASIRTRSTAAFTSSSSPADLIFETTPATSTTLVPRMTILSSGNIGIGTTSPLSRLHITNTGTSTTLGQLSTSLRLQTLTSTAGEGSEILFSGHGGTDAQNVYAAISAPAVGNTSGATGHLVFSTKPDHPSAISERMRIDRFGNVGIGTASPVARLDVNGTIGITGGILGTSMVSSQWIGNGVSLELNSGLTSTGTRFTNGPSNTELMRLTAAGLLGIGTTSPTEILHINAGALATSRNMIRFEGGGWSAPGAVNVVDTDGTKLALHASNNNRVSVGVNGSGDLWFRSGGLQQSGYRFFTAADNTSAPVERVTVLNNGNVGIGAATPTQRLHLGGGIFRMAADSATACDSNAIGSIRFTGSAFEQCVSAGSWATLASGGGGGNGMAPVLLYSNTSNNATVFNTAAFNDVANRLQAGEYIFLTCTGGGAFGSRYSSYGLAAQTAPSGVGTGSEPESVLAEVIYAHSAPSSNRRFIEISATGGARLVNIDQFSNKTIYENCGGGWRIYSVRALPSTTGAPPGNDTELPFNDGGTWGADSQMTFNKSTDVLSVGGSQLSGTGFFMAGVSNLGVLGMTGSGTSSQRAALNVTGTTTTGVISNVALRTNDVDRLVINSSGNVGIGTASPTALLTINKAADPDLSFTGSSGSARIRSGIPLHINPDATTTTDINFNNTANVRICGSGTCNLGVGTISPTQRLHVAGLIRMDSNTAATCDSNANGAIRNNAGTFQFCNGTAWAAAGGAPGGSNTQVQFNNSGALGGSANFVWDNTNSRLGIAVANPTERLHITGNIKISGNLNTAGSPNDNWFNINTGTIGAAGPIFSYGAICSLNNAVDCSGTGGVVIGIVNTNTNINIPHAGNVFFNNGSNVGIGTTSPTQRLHVAGLIRMDSNTAATCDSNANGAIRNNAGTFQFCNGTAWATPGGAIAGGSNTQVQFNNSGALGGSANFVWNNTLNRLGIGTASPAANLHITDSIAPLIHLTEGDTSGNAFIGLDGNNLFIRRGTLGTADAVTVTSAGNVGIGTITPGSRLDVAGLAAVDYLRVDPQDGTNEGGEIQLVGAGSHGTVQIDNFTGDVRIHTLAAGKFFRVLGGGLTTDGNVGIGTATPTGNLTVYSAAANNNSHVRIETTANPSLSLINSGVQSWSAWVDTSDSNKFKIGNTNSGISAGVSRLAIDLSGNVGIGTTTPGARLEVVGNARVGGGGTNGQLWVTRASGADMFSLWTSDGNNTILSVIGAAGNDRFVRFQSPTAVRWDVGMSSAAESGGNAGSNFFINRFSDAGAYLNTPFQISRATGDAAFANNVSVAGNLTVTGTITGAITPTPAGSNTQVQYNNSGAMGASPNLTFNQGTNTLGVGGVIQSTGAIVSNIGGNRIDLTGDGSIEMFRSGGGAYIDLKDNTADDFDVRMQMNGTRLSLSGGIDVADVYATNGGNFANTLIMRGSDPYIRRDVNNSQMVLAGGAGWTPAGAVIALYGVSHATAPGNITFGGADGAVRTALFNNLNVTMTNALNVNGLISGNGKEMFNTGDAYLRINQNNTFSAGTWFGGTNVMIGTGGGIGVGSNGGTTTSRVWINAGTFDGNNVINLNGANGNIFGAGNLTVGSTSNTMSGTGFRAKFTAADARVVAFEGAGATGFASTWWGNATGAQFAIDSINGGGANIWTNNNGAGWGYHSTFAPNGNFGINTSGPTTRLMVLGAATRAASIWQDGNHSFGAVLELGTGGNGSQDPPRLFFHRAGAKAWSVGINSENSFGIYEDGASWSWGTRRMLLNGNGLYIDSGELRTYGSTGWFNETHGGGWFMSDASWIRSRNDKNVWLGGGWYGTNGGITLGYGGGTNGSYQIYGNGNILMAGYFLTSDAREKHDIKAFERSGLDVVGALRAVHFKWNKDNKQDFGVIAQEVEKVLPEAVITDVKGMKAVEYTKLVLPVIEAVKELHAMVKDLAVKVAALFDFKAQTEQELAALKAENAKLKQELEALQGDVLQRLEKLEAAK